MPEPTPCPDCGAEIVACDNRVYLDFPAVTFHSLDAPWTIMRLGSQSWAAAGPPSPIGLGHTLHEHQPPESEPPPE